MRNCLLIAFFLIISVSVFAGKSDSTSTTCWLLPTQAKIQFAGNIGFISGGVGYQMAKNKVEIDFMYGYVPKNLGGTLHSVTLKTTWIPFKKVITGQKTSLDLFTIGMPLTYTFGNQFFFTAPRNKYPERYYDYSSAMRIGIFAGGKVKRSCNENQFFKEAGLYYEIGTYDLLLHNYIFNLESMKFVDLFNLGIGIHVRFGN